MAQPRVLLVDDDEQVLDMMKESLAAHGFEVVPASSVTDALGKIVSQSFDALVTDLHMPGPGDGFAVVTAMRHAQPEVATFVVSGFPDVKRAMADILLQADEILIKPINVNVLTGLIRRRKEGPLRGAKLGRERVASILERDSGVTVQRWLLRVEEIKELTSIDLEDHERIEHLPEIIRNIVARLRQERSVDSTAQPSAAAVAHGRVRFQQGYTAADIVEESRILQVCIFETIQGNLGSVDFSTVMSDVMVIADEVDSQLRQSISSFVAEQQSAA